LSVWLLMLLGWSMSLAEGLVSFLFSPGRLSKGLFRFEFTAKVGFWDFLLHEGAIRISSSNLKVDTIFTKLFYGHFHLLISF
jgi:hypothetical protein